MQIIGSVKMDKTQQQQQKKKKWLLRVPDDGTNGQKLAIKGVELYRLARSEAALIYSSIMI